MGLDLSCHRSLFLNDVPGEGDGGGAGGAGTGEGAGGQGGQPAIDPDAIPDTIKNDPKAMEWLNARDDARHRKGMTEGTHIMQKQLAKELNLTYPDGRSIYSHYDGKRESIVNAIKLASVKPDDILPPEKPAGGGAGTGGQGAGTGGAGNQEKVPSHIQTEIDNLKRQNEELLATQRQITSKQKIGQFFDKYKIVNNDLIRDALQNKLFDKTGGVFDLDADGQIRPRTSEINIDTHMSALLKQDMYAQFIEKGDGKGGHQGPKPPGTGTGGPGNAGTGQETPEDEKIRKYNEQAGKFFGGKKFA